jgi:hypothetical protein
MRWPKNCSRPLTIGFLLFGIAGCFGRSTNEYVPPSDTERTARSLSDVFKAEKPQAFYTEAYGGFRFSSQSLLTISKNGENRTFQGSAAIELDEKGNYHLARIPMTGEATVEVIRLDQKAYLKGGSSSGFRILRPQPEFDRWVTISLREAFALFDQANFGRNAASSTKGSLNCWTQEEDSLCVDPKTGLPMEGSIKTAQPSGAILSFRFNFAPAKPGSIQLGPPS